MNDDVPIEPRVIVAGGAEPPQDTICTTFSVTADEVLASSPFELAFESGVYAAVSVVLPDPTCEIVNAHEPAPPAARAAEQVSLKPSVTVTLPVGVALPDAGLTVKLTPT